MEYTWAETRRIEMLYIEDHMSLSLIKKLSGDPMHHLYALFKDGDVMDVGEDMRDRETQLSCGIKDIFDNTFLHESGYIERIVDEGVGPFVDTDNYGRPLLKIIRYISPNKFDKLLSCDLALDKKGKLVYIGRFQRQIGRVYDTMAGILSEVNDFGDWPKKHRIIMASNPGELNATNLIIAK